jgi:hypothetical protein
MVGNVTSPGAINSNLTGYALQLRNLMDSIREEQEGVVSLGLTGLEGLGFSSTDAAQVLALWSYMNTISGVYYGTATQGTQFSFDNALAQLWAGE